MARPAGSLERFWRWCRNNRRIAAPSTLVSVLLVALTAGSLAASVMIYRARSNAIKNAERAELQRALALDALTSLIQGIQDQLATRPGTLELRRSLLEIARAGLSRVPSGDSVQTSGEVDDKTIQALIKLGDIDFQLGRTSDARAELDQAAQLAERVSSANPNSVPLKRQLGAAYDRVGDEISHTYSSLKEEGEYRVKSYALRQALFAEHSSDPLIRRDLNVSRNRLAYFRVKLGDSKGAQKLLEQSLASLRAEPIDDNNRVMILSDLRYTLGRIAVAASTQVRVPEALAAIRESLAAARALCAIDPQNVSHLRELGFALDSLGTGCLEYGKLPEAEAALLEFRDNRQAAVDADPADQDARRSLALAYQHLGDLAFRRREFDVARASYEQALTRFDEIAKHDQTSIMAHRDRTLAYRKLSSLEAFAGRNQAAAGWLERELKCQNAPGVPKYPEHAALVEEANLLRAVYGLIDRCMDNPAVARATRQDRGGLARAPRDFPGSFRPARACGRGCSRGARTSGLAVRTSLRGPRAMRLLRRHSINHNPKSNRST